MKRRAWLVILVLVLLGLAFPLINLVVPVPVRDSFRNLPTASATEAAAKAILEAKCVMCHMEDPGLPFYANFPIASSLIRRHVTDGTAIWDAQRLLEKHGADEVAMSKLEQTVELGTMPILPYLAMHWNSMLSKAEQQTLIAWVHEVRTQKFTRGLASAEFAVFPVQPLPPRWPEPLNPRKAELGDKLSHDKRLSGDDTISCASCHDLAKGGTDQLQFSVGVRNQVGSINAPTVFNAGFNLAQFWDGRAKDLADQAGQPVVNPIEMDAKWDDVVAKLAKDEALTAIYREIYGADAAWTAANVQDAIAEFEKGLVTPDSPVDRYMKGDRTALTATEARGLELFKAHSCATCHVGEPMGGRSFEKPHDPAAFYKALGRAPQKDDFGRFNVTQNEADRFKMKVPLLRNLALTFPYLHDGSQTDLRNVVRLMHDHFVPPLNRRPLSDADVDAIVAMLKRNTGTLNGRPL